MTPRDKGIERIALALGYILGCIGWKVGVPWWMMAAPFFVMEVLAYRDAAREMRAAEAEDNLRAADRMRVTK